MRKPAYIITIDLGKGVRLQAPFKRRWTLAEWRRMTAYIDGAISRATPSLEDYK